MAMAINAPPAGQTGDNPPSQQEQAPAGGDGGGAPQGDAPGVPHPPKGDAGSGGEQGFNESDGFLPNGENGLMLLADYANSKGGDTQNGDVPGAGDGPTGGDTGFGDGGNQVADAGSDTFQTAQNDNGGGGFGFGGGGGGAGGGAGGGGGSGGGGFTGGGTGGVDGAGGLANPFADGVTVGTGSKPSPDGGPAGQLPVVSSPTPEGDPCVLTNTCAPVPPNTFGPPPNTDTHGGGDTPPGGGAEIHTAAVPEPATWLMLIVGFMGMGSALRVQHRGAALA